MTKLAMETPQTLPEKRQFPQKTIDELQALMKRYPTKRACLLPALRLAERDFGCIDWGGMRCVAEQLDLTPAYVWSVFSFYTHFRRPTDGKYVIEVCRTLPCALRGADKLAREIAAELHLQPGETSKDGRFTLKDAECMATCDLAPSCQVNGLDHNHMTIEKFREIVKALP